MAEQRVIVEIHLGVERDHVAAVGKNQRIDLGERCIGFVECLVEPLQHEPRFRERRFGDADLARDVIGLAALQARHRVDEHLMDILRCLGGDFLDIHAALATRHQAHALRAAVNHHADVELLLDVGAFFDQESPYFLPQRAGLMRLQHHAENPARMLLHFVERFCKLDAAALAAAAGMDLGFHHPHFAAELCCRLDRLIDAEARHAARGCDAILTQDFFRLVFVNLH